MGWRIPLRTLRYESSKPQTWGLNFQRNVRRKREIVYWSPVSRIFNLNRVSSAGILEGLELSTPRNFKVTPYGLGAADRDFSVDESANTDAEFGVDAKIGITPSMNLDLTYNTDFAQVEVDDQQVNLTRFSLFFPEKRPFFLENAGNFTMGQSQAVELFFSRRIGISDEGEIVPILAGARVSGKLRDFDVGFMNMQTEDKPGIAIANNYTVASLIREFPNRSRVGALFVNRTATGDFAGEYTSLDKYLFVVEGFFDALHVDGISVQQNKMSSQQMDMIGSSPRKKVVIPDFNGDSNKLAEQALSKGWGLALPDYHEECDDVTQAIQQFGKMTALQKIMDGIHFDYRAEINFQLLNMKK